MVDDELETCVECGEMLLAMDDLPPEDAERLVLLTHCQPAEAQILRATLENEGIQAMVEDEGLLELLNPFDVAAPDAEGDVRVLVHLKDAEAALEILEEKETGQLALEEDEEEDEEDFLDEDDDFDEEEDEDEDFDEDEEDDEEFDEEEDKEEDKDKHKDDSAPC
jgi:hypothetical protein